MKIIAYIRCIACIVCITLLYKFKHLFRALEPHKSHFFKNCVIQKTYTVNFKCTVLQIVRKKCEIWVAPFLGFAKFAEFNQVVPLRMKWGENGCI
jgi:hypothetical protein